MDANAGVLPKTAVATAIEIARFIFKSPKVKNAATYRRLDPVRYALMPLYLELQELYYPDMTVI